MNTRFLLGLVAAALWLPLLLLATSGRYGMFWFVMVSPFTILLTLVAAPIAFLFRRNLSLLVCVVAGVVAGGIGVLLFWLATNPLAAGNWAPLLVVAGLLSGLVFWAVGVRGNHLLDISRTSS